MGDGRLRMADFGDSPQAAMRSLLQEFASRGWSSSSTDAAVRIIRVLQSASPDGVMAAKVATAAGRDFLIRNGVSEGVLRDALHTLAARPKI